MLRSRRFALVASIATVAVLGLTACGDAADTTSGAKAPAVIHLGAASGTGKLAAGAEVASDRMMMPYQPIDFVYDGTFPDLGTSAEAWTLPVGSTVDQAKVAELARLLGVEGDVRQLAPEMGGGWMVGAEDYSTSNLTVTSDGMASWWYNPAPMATPNTSVGCAGVGTEGGAAIEPAVEPAVAATDTVATPDTSVLEPATTAVPSCEAPAPPTGVPTKDEALAKAKALFTDMGYDLSQFDFDVYADEWGANVTAFRLLAGHRSPLSLSAGYGAEGALTWASGALAEPVPAGEYPLVSGDEAVQRLNDQTGMWSMYGPAMYKGGVALDATTAIASREVTSVGTEAVAPDAPVTGDTVSDIATDQPQVIDPMPVDSLPEMEPITVHLNGARLDLTMVWAEDNTIWLLPAYTFTATDGGEYTVIAVDDSFIAMPDPVTPDTTPVETVVTAPVDTAPVDTTGPVETAPAEVDLTVASQALVGLTVDEATKVAEGNGWVLRVTTLDGESQASTADYRPERVNVSVEAGLVTSVDFGG